MAWLELLLWGSLIMVGVVTLGYPLALTIAGLTRQRERRIDDAVPHVTLMISAYNEETCIARKIQNSLALDYPADRLDILVASDGSTDSTDTIVQSFATRGVTLRSFPRTGKTGMQNAVVREARGDVIVFSDANALYRPDAVRKLVRNFADPGVGCVCGQLVYSSDLNEAGACERSYWSYEKFLKERESALSSLVGVNGSIYALRREDYVELGADLISDFVEPLAIVRNGKRVVYEPDAVSVEEASTTHAMEFRRKVRILTRSIKGLLHMRGLLNPFRYGLFSFQLLVHKLLRYLVPLFLATAYGSLALLAVFERYQLLFVLTTLSIVCATIVARGTRQGASNPLVRMCHLLYYYLMVNYALVPAWLNIIKGARVTLWVPERKQA